MHPAIDLSLSILHFNLLPSRYMDASWRSQYFPETLMQHLFATDQAENHISRHVLVSLQLENSVYLDTQWPHWLLVLSTEEQLTAYALASGCLLLRHVLQHTIQREQVMYYRKQLGGLYPFILEKGPLIHPNCSVISIDPEQLLEKAQELGWLILRQAASLFPMGIQKRFLLKLPYEIMTLNLQNTTLSAPQALTLLTRICYEMGAK